MTEKKDDGLKLTPEMRAFAEKSVNEAEKAFTSFMSATQKALDDAEGVVDETALAARELGHKALAATGEGIASTFSHARDLTQAKGLEEVMRLQSEFLKKQMVALGEQARLLGDAAQSLAARKSGPKKD